MSLKGYREMWLSLRESSLPCWERLFFHLLGAGVRFISIHAPVLGATAVCRIIPWRVTYFNPRSRVGSDPHNYRNTIPFPSISIHAPVLGAT